MRTAVWVARVARSGAAVLLAVVLQACGGGGGGGEAGGDGGLVTPGTGPGDVGNHFPLVDGARWIYGVDGFASRHVRIDGQRNVGGELAWVMRFDRNGSESAEYVVKTVDAVRVLPDPSDEFATKLGAYDVLRFPLEPGRRFRQLQKTILIDLDADGTADQAFVHSEVSVVALADVTTAAGRFVDAVQVRTVMDLEIRIAGSGQVEQGTITTDDWYAPGVGLVRTQSVSVSRGQELSRSLEEVSAYGVGDRRSDMDPPQLISASPADGGVRGTDAMVRLTLSEAMDQVSMRAARIVVRGSDGAVLPGAMAPTANTLRWIYNGPMPVGDYVASLEGTLTDLSGNPLPAPPPWRFTIAAQASPVKSVSPAPGAVDMPLDQVITIEFDEFPHPTQIAGYVGLSDADGAVPVSVALAGRTLTITPQRLLKPGQFHTFTVSAQAPDLYGNPLLANGYGVTQTFITANGLLAYPRRLPLPGEPRSIAIGDVDGDGRNELLALVPGDLTAPLHILRVQADGSAAVLARVSTTIQVAGGECFAENFAFGDVSGDGLGDIVLAASCGLRVLVRQPDGSYQSWSDVANPGFGRIRLADIDGDGRLDVVSHKADVFQRANEFRVWRWPAGPVAVPGDPFDIGMDGIMDFRVGDINADGRADIVVNLMEAGNNLVAWRLQTPDGRFGDVQSRAFGVTLRSEALVLGDVNQDGLTDVIVQHSGNRPTNLYLLPQMPGGSLGPAQALSTYDLPGPMVVTDLDGDGRNDILVGHNAWLRLGVYFGAAGGQLEPEFLHSVTYANYGPDSLAVGDLNGDGRPDVVLGSDLLLHRELPAQAQGVRTRAAACGGGAPRAGLRAELRVGLGSLARACAAR